MSSRPRCRSNFRETKKDRKALPLAATAHRPSQKSPNRRESFRCRRKERTCPDQREQEGDRGVAEQPNADGYPPRKHEECVEDRFPPASHTKSLSRSTAELQHT
jgi:hypothetical protein